MLEAFFFFSFVTTLTFYAVRVQMREEKAWREQAWRYQAPLARPGMPVVDEGLVCALPVAAGRNLEEGGL
jgi:hypothetical protein